MMTETLPPATSPAQLALSRVTRELERVTDELIRLLFEQSRNSSPGLAARVEQLEAQRDTLHERLAQLENWSKKSL